MKKNKSRQFIDGPVYELGPPDKSNPIVSLLEWHGILWFQIITLKAKANEIQNLSTKFRDYRIYFVGVSSDAGYSTPLSLEYGEGKKILDIWEVAIHWGNDDYCYAAAVWSKQQLDFIFSTEMGPLNALNGRSASRLTTDALALIRWVQARLTKKAYEDDREAKIVALKLDLLKAAADMGREPKKPRQRSGLNIEPLAKKAGYGKQTIYDLLEAEPEFKRELEAAFDSARIGRGDH